MITDTLILVEHPKVITLGKSASKEHIVVSEEALKKAGVELFEINRGGDVTYHGEGQLVGYPIVNLIEKKWKVRSFVENLELVFIRLLKEYGIESEAGTKEIGVWIGNEKITAIGLAVKRGVTMHGFAFNINTQLEDFQFIVPCGIQDKGVTSLKKLKGETMDFERVSRQVIDHFTKVYEYDEIKDVNEDGFTTKA